MRRVPLFTLVLILIFAGAFWLRVGRRPGPTVNRSLSAAELDILQIARDHLGPQNTEQDVFFTDEGGAAIFAKARDGSQCIMLHLTNLADFLRSGSMTRADIIDDIKAGCGGGAA